MNLENPYSASLEPPQLVDAYDWRQVIRRWEWLRIAYNLVVGAVGLSVLVSLGKPGNWVVESVVAYGVAANACYFFGPIAELYLAFWGLRWRGIGWILFSAGLGFSVLLTVGLGMLAAMPVPFD